VYLIASTKKLDVAVLGRHHRVLVSGDGKRVLHDEPLSKGILELPMAGGNLPPGARAVSLVVSHILSDAPIETHVFASLRYGIAIDVVTKAGSWRVERGKVEYLGASATAASPI
jgi:hypothetical protein